MYDLFFSHTVCHKLNKKVNWNTSPLYDWFSHHDIGIDNYSIRDFFHANQPSRSFTDNPMVQIDILQFPRKLQKGDPIAGKYGLRAATMFGLGILRSNEVEKITNIK